jgi:hypothetical protein
MFMVFCMRKMRLHAMIFGFCGMATAGRLLIAVTRWFMCPFTRSSWIDSRPAFQPKGDIHAF